MNILLKVSTCIGPRVNKQANKTEDSTQLWAAPVRIAGLDKGHLAHWCTI